MNAKIYGVGQDTESPLPKVFAIASMDFPEIMAELRQLDILASEFVLWMTRAAQKRLNGDFESVNEGLSEVFNPYLKSLSAVENKLRLEILPKL